jgi:outer membrane protein OmpA-like peptidoglycan-associated protein
MKNLVSLAFFCLLIHQPAVLAQTDQNLGAGYYIVVSANSPKYKVYASEYVEVLRKKGYEKADYGFDVRRNKWLVYVEYFQSYVPSITRMRALRAEGEFTDAWVRIISGDMPRQTSQPPQAKETVTREVPVAAEPPLEEPEEKIEVVPPAADEKPDPEGTDLVVMQKPEKAKPNTLADIKVFLSLINPTNNRIVEGEVQVVDTERAKLLKRVPGNEELLLPNPNTATGTLSLISDVFGYRRVQHEIDYDQPLVSTQNPAIEFAENVLVVNFDLERLRRGDRAILYNVYFYNDAAIMKPESIFELNSLVQMMNDNEDYKIRLHGHTNDRYYGKMILPGPNREYFKVTDDAVEKDGSAKGLSKERAETIRHYLMDQGVAGKRVEVKAWGGKKPLYDRVGENAARNVRVEVEVLKD